VKLMTFEQWRQDLYVACRGLLRVKAFTGTAVATLAVGIAGVTVMFALIEGVLLRPLPVQEQDRLLVAWKELRSSGFAHYPFRVAELDTISKESRLLESAAGVDYNGAQPWIVVEEGSATYVQSAAVTGDFFGVVGVEPLLGRALNRADDVIGAENVIAISHGLWQRRYGGTRDVLGRRLTLRERRFTIVGVMPAGFEYPRGAEAWVSMTALTSTIIDPNYTTWVDVIARLHQGATIEQAATELGGLTARLESEAPPDATRGLTPVVRSYEDVVVGDVRLTLFVLFAAVGLVLLIASANVANLLLMRGEGRRAEMAIRSTLGAARSRLVRQMLAESLVLALASGAAGLAVTWWSLSALIALVPDGLPRVDSIRLDAGVLGFAMAIAFITSALAGMAPALSASRIDLVSQSRSGGGMRGSGARHGRRTLVVAQVALAITVVAAAGLLTRSVLLLEAADMGLTAEELVLVQLALPQAKYVKRDRRLQFLDDVVKELEATPGIAGATPVNTPPFAGTGGWDAPTFTVEGQGADRAAANSSLNLESIHPNYFATVGVSLIRGRGFGPADREGAPDVVIVSEDVAALTWPGEEPIGKRLKLGGAISEEPWRTVVGVARTTRYRELREPRATLYLPAAQFMFGADAIVLRSTAPAGVVAGAARDRIRAVDPAAQVMRVTPFADLLDRPLARPRFDAFVLGVFGIAALILAAIGLYAVMGAYVRHRNTEIGIRVALGATASDVRRLVVGEGLWLAGLGAVIGLAGAAATTRLLRGLLFGVHPLDAVSMLAAVLLVIGASLLASYLPASRAARVDPVTLLRAG
jgi:putative ABC transport system permease protein